MADDFVVELRVDLTGDITGQLSRQLGAANSQFTGFDKNVASAQKTLAGTAGASNKLAASLSTTRYALYDVSSSLAITGVALLGIATATTAVAIAWERDFANVARTSGAVGPELDSIRSQLVDIAQTLPVAFGDVTKIATLGAQLGIANEDLTEFTTTVVKFSAATGISVEESAQAFGRLGNILGVGADAYDQLGSSIVKAGVSAVATESEIVAVAQQIGPIARLAGASASEVIGLATAFASVKIPPELARSVVTKTFGDIERAVAGGGEKLEKFGQALGISGQQFASAWKKDSTDTFVRLLEAIPTDGSAAIQTLDGLGLSSQRNTPALQKLAQNTQLVRDSLTEAGTGFAENSELNRQFGIISETTAAKLQVFVNNFMALMDALGSANLGPLGDVLDLLSGFLQILTDAAGNDFVAPFIGFATVVAGLAGVLTLAAAGMALFGASSIGVYQGLQGLSVIAPRATAAILGAGTASAIASGEMRAGALSAAVLGRALKALGLISIALVLPDLTKWAADGIYALKGLDSNFGKTFDRVKEDFSDGVFGELDISGLNGFTAGVQRFFAAFDEGGLKDVARVDEEIAKLANSGNIDLAKAKLTALRDEFVLEGKGNTDAFNALFKDSVAAIGELAPAVTSGSQSFATLDEAMANTQAEAQATQDSLNALKDAILNFGETSISAEEAEIAFKRGLQDLQEGVADTTIGLDGSTGASLDFIQSMVDMGKQALDSAEKIITNGGTVEEATQKYRDGRQAIIDARIAKGEDADAAAAWADRVLGSAAEGEQAIKDYSAEVNRIPEKKETRIYIDASGAYRDIDSLINYINSRTATFTVTERIVYESDVMSGGRGHLVPGAATGGQILGPGTGTSDSILARLSNGEFVMKAATVQKYGTAFMHALNAGKLPAFASGGPVSGGNASAAVMGGVVELGPRSLSRLSQSVTNNIMLDDAAISRAAQRGDAYRRSTGEL